MVIYVLMWLALSVVVVAAFAFGSSVGYHRGFEEAKPHRGGPRRRDPAARPGNHEIRLPEDMHLGA